MPLLMLDAIGFTHDVADVLQESDCQRIRHVNSCNCTQLCWRDGVAMAFGMDRTSDRNAWVSYIRGKPYIRHLMLKTILRHTACPGTSAMG